MQFNKQFQEVSCNLGLFSTSGEGEGTGGSLRRGEDVRVEATWFIAVGIALDVR
jgi:hypothetical protein